MESLAIAGLLIVPPLLVAVLHRTRLYWLPGASLLAAAFYAFGLVETADSDSYGLTGLGNFFVICFGIVLGVYGIGALIVSSRLHARYRRTVENLPPTATAVAGVTEP
jgi:hypothetical protein